ncbi:hypothetical protein BJ165DRAFT_1408105 [Panaeolus papilionaceus]|nr:hypothetical protein BJ165DRAFT_1408105 [Panaeolus papilionaceus]
MIQFIESCQDGESLENIGHHDLTSGTKQITFTFIKMEDTGSRLVLVDTPGFEDADRSNSSILEEISKYLQSMYQKKHFFSGIVFLHPISEVRFDLGASRVMRIFKGIYGNEGLGKLAMVTTMWNNVQAPSKNAEECENREKELRSEHWATLFPPNDPASLARFDASPGKAQGSAMSIVLNLLQQSMGPKLRLKLQRELERGVALPRTEAGRAAFNLAATARFYLAQISS